MAPKRPSRGGRASGGARKQAASPKRSSGAGKAVAGARKRAGRPGARAGGARKKSGTLRKRTVPALQTTEPPHYATGHGYIHFKNKNQTNTEVAADALALWGQNNLPQQGASFYSVSAMDDPFATTGPGQSRPKGDLVIALVMTSEAPHSHAAHVRVGNIATAAATALSQYFHVNAQEPKHWCCWSDH